MRYLNNILYIEGSEYIKGMGGDGFVDKNTYDLQKRRGKIIVNGRGGSGAPVLIEYESIPQPWRNLLNEKYNNDIYGYAAKAPIRALIKPDLTAMNYFARYRKPDGTALSSTLQNKYANDAAILNALKLLMQDKKQLKALTGGSVGKFWDSALVIIKDVSLQFPNTLPASVRRLKPRYNDYATDGYGALISDRVGNDNTRKVDANIHRLLHSIAYSHNKPYAKEVHDYYQRYMAGEIDVVCLETGELLDRSLFYDSENATKLSVSAVYQYLNLPFGTILTAKKRTSSLEYSTKIKPHVHRSAPQYSFSKVTMDDISIPFKMADGNRVWAYQIFDVTSGAVVGCSFGKEKNRQLFTDAIINMFHLVANKGWGMPAEIEVEQHIANTFADDLLAEGNVFPFVRFCRGGNPQEKRAEGFIGGKKKSLQRKREGFQRRPFASLEANRMNEDADKIVYSYDVIVANEQMDIIKWNTTMHPDQVKYKGLTRWQVLCSQQNPGLNLPEKPMLAQYIGYKTTTTIQRSQYVQVQYNKYILPTPELMKQVNSLQVTAYYIPQEDGSIPEVYLYQSDTYLCTAGLIAKFNESQAERTDADRHNMHRQFNYINAFNSMVKAGTNDLLDVHIVEDTTPLMATFDPHSSPFYTQNTAVSAPVLAVKKPHKNDINRLKINDLGKNNLQTGADFMTEKALNDL